MFMVSPATAGYIKMIELHDYVQFFLVLILIFVLWFYITILLDFGSFNSKQQPVRSLMSNYTHNKTRQIAHLGWLEVLWTIIPIIILTMIAIPSFKLLYALDVVNSPLVTLRCIGNQWYWTYECEFDKTIPKQREYLSLDEELDIMLGFGLDQETPETIASIRARLATANAKIHAALPMLNYTPNTDFIDYDDYNNYNDFINYNHFANFAKRQQLDDFTKLLYLAELYYYQLKKNKEFCETYHWSLVYAALQQLQITLFDPSLSLYTCTNYELNMGFLAKMSNTLKNNPDIVELGKNLKRVTTCDILTEVPHSIYVNRVLHDTAIEMNTPSIDALIPFEQQKYVAKTEYTVWSKFNQTAIRATSLTEANPFVCDSYLLDEDDLQLGAFRLLEVDTYPVLPADAEIRIAVTGTDVIHSFAVPSLGVKIDAIPGRLNQFGIKVRSPGVYYGQCSELCGVGHGFMPIKILFTKVIK